MASPSFPELQVEPTPLERVDALLDTLDSNREAWVRTSVAERAQLLRACIPTTLAVADAWVEAAGKAKGLTGDERLGEEYLGGPMTLIRNLRLYAESLEAGAQPRLPGTHVRPDGQHVAEVFPGNTLDKLMFTGFSAEVWIEKGHTPTQARLYRDKAAGKFGEGGVGLVLGAGNVASIGPMDALYKLIVDDEVVIVKTNPVNAYLAPYWEAALKPLMDAGFYFVVNGGAEVGSHLCHHPKVTSVHITGSDATHDAIVWGGDPEERKRRKEAGEPLLTKPITSELGCVTPVIVVPGPWTEGQMRYQARHVAGMVANNGSFNCNAAKAIVVAKGWHLKERFLSMVREELARTPARKAYYPGAHDRYARFLDNYPNAEPVGPKAEESVPWTWIPNVPPEEGEYALTQEAFCGVVAEVEIDATGPAEFLEKVVPFCNDTLWGTLSCMMLVHPSVEKEYPAALDRAIADLRYGGIGINVWAGLIYGLVVTTWGAYPGHPLEDIRSGRGVVHNSYFLDHPEKSVVRAPFTIFPTPVWFADNKQLLAMGKKMTAFEANPSLVGLPKVLVSALRG